MLTLNKFYYRVQTGHWAVHFGPVVTAQRPHSRLPHPMLSQLSQLIQGLKAEALKWQEVSAQVDLYLPRPLVRAGLVVDPLLLVGVAWGLWTVGLNPFHLGHIGIES